MDEATLQQTAQTHLERLRANPYPGRGIVLGQTAGGTAWLQLYWIMGRSENSRNRVFVADGQRLRTEPLHPEKVENPELVIYNAMDVHEAHHVVTNGDQTDTVMDALRRGAGPEDALRTRRHEHDAPHYTPRISGGVHAVTGSAWLAILKADHTQPAGSRDGGVVTQSLRQFHEFEALPAGLGWCLTTYAGDGSPLPSYGGEPMLLPLSGEGEELIQAFWGALNAENRVALALKTIPCNGSAPTLRIMNQYSK